MRILAVDDSPFIRDLVPTLLQRTGFPPVQVAASGEEALDVLQAAEDPFDCFILDIEMPGMDGIELCTRIRALDAYRETPVIMLTARYDGDSVERAFAAGANDYIFKRFEVKEFTSRVYIAERFLRREESTLTLDPARLDPTRPSGQHGFDMARSLRIAGIERLILPFSLGNYVSQLPRNDLDDSRVFAVRVDRIFDMYWYGNTYDLVRVLGDVAKAVVRAVASPRLLMAYSGNGIFLCVARGVHLPAGAALEAAIQENLAASTLCTQIGEVISTSVCVGEPIVPRAYKTQRVKKTFARAIERASARHVEKSRAASKA